MFLRCCLLSVCSLGPRLVPPALTQVPGRCPPAPSANRLISDGCLSSGEWKLLQVSIPPSPPVAALLGANLTLPCLVSLAPPPPSTNGRHAVLSLPRVKWSLLVNGEEAEILVARGDKVQVSEAYRRRASLLDYARSPADLTLLLQGLRRSDSGVYRCEVQQGLEEDGDVAMVKVKGESASKTGLKTI